MEWSGGGVVKKIAVQSAALTIWCQPLAGESWQAGRWALAVCVTDCKIRADMQRFPQPRLLVLKLIIAAEAAVTHELTVACTVVHSRSRPYALSGCKVTSPITNYRHRASFRSRGSKLHGSTTTRAMCPGVICQTNYLSWACNCSENRYSGNCVVSCNVKWCFPSIFRRDERSKDCSVQSGLPVRQSLKIHATDESQPFEWKRRAPWC